MKNDLSSEEKDFWKKVSLRAALYDVLGVETVDALMGAKIHLPRIIDLAAKECFMYPEKLGVRRHTERIRKIARDLSEGKGTSEDPYDEDN